MKTQKIVSLILAIALVFSVGCVSAFAADVVEPKEFETNGELNLSDIGSFEADGKNGAIYAGNGAKLKINGEGTVKALLGDDGYSMAVWAYGAGTEVEINGGSYENTLDKIKDPDHVDLIYASGDADITINGGTFKCATPRWTLNCKNYSGSTITVKGGKFWQFDPSNAKTDGENEIIVPAGYAVVKTGDWYEVVSEAKVLNLSDDIVTNGCDGAIWAKNGAKLTINGKNENLVKGLACPEDGFSMAVYALGNGTEVEINGGRYENELDTKFDETHVDLIYAKDGASIVINGGTFKCETPRWTLNCHNTKKATITVKGGKFWQFDPSNAKTDGENEIVVPEGYAVVKNGEWYEVVEGAKASIAHDSTSSVANEAEGALRFVFKVTIPTATETYFGAYLLPLDVFKATGVTKAVQVQYAATEVKDAETFSADLVKIPSVAFGKEIYAIPYIKTTNGVETFKGASASVNSAPKAQ